jgi:hypothetical protein
MAAAFKPEALVLGLSLVALGAVWVLSNLGRVDLLATLRVWWPLALIVWGVLEVAASLGRREGRRN